MMLFLEPALLLACIVVGARIGGIALNPVIGHAKGDELAKEAYETGKGLLELVREKHVLTEEQIKKLLDPAKLTGLDREKYAK